MNYLSVNAISKSYGIKTLFEEVTFGIEKGDKTALIATNGSGKSTMLKILVGKESPDSGTVTYANDIKIGYLEQLPVYPSGTRISDLLADLNDEQHLKARQYLTRFAITNLEQSVDELSGGQVKRLALALVLLHEPDFLILDEPTNHLDVEMVEWLEKFLTQSSMTLLMVTHDRYFLDRVCNKIFELYQGVMYTHNGNFDYYVQKSREREEVKRATAERNSQLLKYELEWMRSTPQARTGKSKSRIDAFYDLKERSKYQEQDERLEFGLQMQRLGGKILELSNV
jgi:ATP-binding cassette subfamily F protein uup